MVACASGERGPVVLCVGGHDPSAAGVQADIETCAALDCLALSVITALTTQNTARLRAVTPLDEALVETQIRTLLEEFPIDAIKLGLLPTVALVARMATLCHSDLADRPLVIDPLLEAGSGGQLAQPGVADALREHLLPRATLCTPNRAEALQLARCEHIDDAGQRLLALGCRAVLITDSEPGATDIVNRLYLAHGAMHRFAMPRLPGTYHGTGCTLASALACALAQGADLIEASAAAQRFAHGAVEHAWRPGSRQHIPRRRRPL